MSEKEKDLRERSYDTYVSTDTLGPKLPERSSASILDELPVVDSRRYEVSGELARGGLGRILQARDPLFDRPVALKELLRKDADAKIRFVREALITARLQHPSIV